MVSGKHSKREIKRRKAQQRAAAARAERQRTIFTLIVIGVVLAIGALLVAVSVDDGDAVAEPPQPTVAPIDAQPCTPAPAPAEVGADKPTYDAAPTDVLEPDVDYRAIVETSCGTVEIDLFEDATPQAVANFVFLAREGFYDSLEIFRNAPSIFALQTGAGDNDASWQIGYTFEDELSVAEEQGYTAGSVAMANAGPDTSGSQFFFVYADSPLPPQYTKFGQVVEGLEVLQSIGAIPVEGETPTEDVYLESVTIQTAEGAASPSPSPTSEAQSPEGPAATDPPAGTPSP